MSEPSFRVQRIDHVELFVPDQRQAARWYRDVLGLEIIEELAHWAADGPLMVATAEGPTMLALFAGEPGHGHGLSPDFRRVAFRTDAEGFVAFLDRLPGLELEAADGAFLSAGDVVDHGASLSLYFDDPWGHAFELTTYETERVRELRGAQAT